MATYQEARVKNMKIKQIKQIKQLNKLKYAAKNTTWTIVRISKKNFEDEELPHELFVTTRQTTKIRNVSTVTICLTICQQIKNLIKLKYLK